MSKDFPLYQCHKKVRAFKIQTIIPTPSGANMLGVDRTYRAVVDKDYMEKHQPKSGGYYVSYSDEHESFSPAEPFEEGYTLVEDAA